MPLTKLQKLVLLMTFWFAPGGDIKQMMWEDFTGGKPLSEETLFLVMAFVINGVDEGYVAWAVMNTFIEEMNAKSGIVVDQVEAPVAVDVKPKRARKPRAKKEA